MESCYSHKIKRYFKDCFYSNQFSFIYILPSKGTLQRRENQHLILCKTNAEKGFESFIRDAAQKKDNSFVRFLRSTRGLEGKRKQVLLSINMLMPYLALLVPWRRRFIQVSTGFPNNFNIGMSRTSIQKRLLIR